MAPAYDLMRGGSDLVELSLNAARARSAVVRAASGQELDEADRSALERMSGVLEAAATSVAFFAADGSIATLPADALSARVDATIEAARYEARAARDPARLSQLLTSLAQASRAMERPGGSSDEPDMDLAEFYGDLATRVLRNLGHVGETASKI